MCSLVDRGVNVYQTPEYEDNLLMDPRMSHIVILKLKNTKNGFRFDGFSSLSTRTVEP